MALSKFTGGFSFTKFYRKLIKHTVYEFWHQTPGEMKKSGLRSGSPLILPSCFWAYSKRAYLVFHEISSSEEGFH